jgi:hypothetical protein
MSTGSDGSVTKSTFSEQTDIHLGFPRTLLPELVRPQ